MSQLSLYSGTAHAENPLSEFKLANAGTAPPTRRTPLRRILQNIADHPLQVTQRVAHRHQIAERQVAVHVRIPRPPSGPVFRIEPDDTLRSLRQPPDNIRARIGAVAARV